ncbi:MAG: toxin-antitoxin system TumE family protein [Ardenticatenaceae bacterium]
MTIYDYFSSLERGLTHNIKIGDPQQPIISLASDDYNGLIRCRLFFWDGSYLSLYEVVSTEQGYPEKIYYAYTYIRSGQRVFRYDNAPHHPQIHTFPHHKHVGPADTLMPSEEPTLAQVLAEIESFLNS